MCCCGCEIVNESPRAPLALGSFFSIYIKNIFKKLILKLINIRVQIPDIRVRLNPESDPDMCRFLNWVPDFGFLYIRTRSSGFI